MKTGKYDIGIAFDGDADRIGVIDEKGDMLWADQIIALFLPEIIKNGETILFDVKSQLMSGTLNFGSDFVFFFNSLPADPSNLKSISMAVISLSK